MSTHDPSSNGGPSSNGAPVPMGLEPVDPAELQLQPIDPAELQLQPVDPAELQLRDVPTVEVAVLPQATTGLAEALRWFLLYAAICLGTLAGAVGIVNAAYPLGTKILLAGVLILFSLALLFGFAIYSATKKGFTFGKAFLWCAAFVVVTQLVPAAVGVIGLVVTQVAQGGDKGLTMNSPEMDQFFQAILLSGQFLGICFSLLLLRWSAGRGWRRKIGFVAPSPQHVALVVVAMPALMVLSIALEPLVARCLPSLSRFGISLSVDEFIKRTEAWWWPLAVLVIGIGPAIGEELWCRGFLGQALASRYGNWGAILLASFLFGLIHVEPPQAAMAFLMGIVLHLCYLASRSIFVPMLIHFMNNTLAVLDKSQSAPLPVVLTLERAYSHSKWLSVIASLAVLGLVGTLLVQTRVRILTPSATPLPDALYPHVELPVRASANAPVSGGMPAFELGALLVAVCFFTAIWFGL
jgi:membrane protease YdiL (CAAX protease family)